MSTNYYRRNNSAGTYAASASRPRTAGRRGSLRHKDGVLFASAPVFDPTADVPSASVAKSPALGASFPAASFPPPGNVVELFPGAGGTPGARRGIRLVGSEAGMATAEYAIATLAAVGFAGLLVFILRSDEVRGFLLNLIRTALALP
ncbi:DUF4244 domain-containing protein [Pseudarthrobacter sp. Fe7]|nr:DUF4244 domain-containing protein [Pseudarthrobacter sp. Fe7]